MNLATIGIIGGSGLYSLAHDRGMEEREVDTPYGKPSSSFMVGEIEGRKVAFLPRHGRNHEWSPSQINYRANIYGFKILGVERLLAVSAVGSLKEEIAPMDVVIPDQFIDRTRHRPDSFYGDGIVVHVSMAEPFCKVLTESLVEAATGLSVKVHPRGTYVCIEGPQFSTRAESHLYRNWGASIIGMTNLQEAKLAREAEICYSTLALVTDYDCWREGDHVDVETVLDYLAKNAATARKMLLACLASLPSARACRCGQALENAVLTRPDSIDADTRRRLEPLIGHRLPPA
ncbi:MAG: S-methyl-5'-thioadenosine phosphorylase [Acidobacteriota bacterium]